jgi:putative heme iron utilization protein
MDAHAPADDGGNGGPTTGATTAGPPPTPPSPDDATRARTLVAAQRLATLSTLRPDGAPFGSVVQYAVVDGGAPVTFISELAEHTKHLRADGRASLLVTSPVAGGDDPMAHPRVSLVGRIAPHAQPDEVRDRFFERHPTARTYADFADFAFWQLDVEAVRFVGGYGRMSWVDGPGYAAAAADPLADQIAYIVDHMNDDHADACLAYVQALAGLPAATAARLLCVDRLGMDLLADTPSGIVPTRVNYPEPADDAYSVQVAVVGMLRAIRGADAG